jgi:hypothetical protein
VFILNLRLEFSLGLIPTQYAFILGSVSVVFPFSLDSIGKYKYSESPRVSPRPVTRRPGLLGRGPAWWRAPSRRRVAVTERGLSVTVFRVKRRSAPNKHANVDFVRLLQEHRGNPVNTDT